MSNSLRTARLLGIMLGVGVLVQIILGEMQLVHGLGAMVHITIGYAGLALALAYLIINRRSRIAILIAAIIFIFVVMQVALGTALFMDRGSEGLEISHRATAYVLLAAGLLGGLTISIIRRREAEAAQES